MFAVLVGVMKVMAFKSHEHFSWEVVDDRVMGGRSNSKLNQVDHGWRWEGRLSYENQGGFSSIRTNWNQGFLQGTDSIVIQVRGSERVFKFRLESSPRYYDPVFEMAFLPHESWQTLILPLELFEATVLGKPMRNASIDFNTSSMGRMGMMCNSGEAGEFWLEFQPIELR